jgi:hypothetical protein
MLGCGYIMVYHPTFDCRFASSSCKPTYLAQPPFVDHFMFLFLDKQIRLLWMNLSFSTVKSPSWSSRPQLLIPNHDNSTRLRIWVISLLYWVGLSQISMKMPMSQATPEIWGSKVLIILREPKWNSWTYPTCSTLFHGILRHIWLLIKTLAS